MGDASAVLGIINRKGLGKTRHIDTGLLWIQQTVAKRELSFNKVHGKENPADLYTKYLDESTILTHSNALVYQFTDGKGNRSTKVTIGAGARLSNASRCGNDRSSIDL